MGKQQPSKPVIPPPEGHPVTLKIGFPRHLKMKNWFVDQYLPNEKILIRCKDENATLEVTIKDINWKI